MTAEIKYVRFANMFGRTIALCKLVDPNGNILVGADGQASVAQSLTYANANNIVISNAQQILTTLVITGGFGA